MNRYILTFAVQLSLISACCYPNQFHGHVTTIGHTKSSKSLTTALSGYEIWYDQCNNRIRYDFWGDNLRLTSIFNYRLKEYYLIRNGRCSMRPLSGNVRKMCARSGGNIKWLGNYIVGNTLLTKLFGYNLSTDKYSTGYSQSLTSTCLPITTASYYQSKSYFSTSVVTWTNITLGISDLHAFDKPPQCNGSTGNTMIKDLDMMDVIGNGLAYTDRDIRN